MTTILILGFLLGVRHALEADHVAAVAALASRSASLRQSVELATVWGAGHWLILVIVALAMTMLDASLPESVARAFEIAAGVILIVLGLDVLRRVRRDHIHFHVHRHDDGRQHLHAHAHHAEPEHDPTHHRHEHVSLRPRALLVGGVHGMGGSAAVTVLSIQALGSPKWAVLYAALFGLGSILGMVLFTIVLSVPMRRTADHLGRFAYSLQMALGATTVGLGLWMAWTAAVS